MAGIYIHIPFCRQKCYYCDFYKTVNTALTPKFMVALNSEINTRKEYLNNELVETIYFGGGTPSVLTEHELTEILTSLKSNFQISPSAEITFEVNPDDLSPAYLQQIFNSGINRLSMGIQSFHDDLLKIMNRRHNAAQAAEAVENAAKTGFTDISIDLIYGLPGLTQKVWNESLMQAFCLPVTHVSAYHLTYHKGTPFFTWLKKGTLKPATEPASVAQFNLLTRLAKKHGFEHYEISNFAKNQLYSKHNTSYWNGTKYLGLGPSAHSFNLVSRSWNMASTEGYIKAIANNQPFTEEEILTENNRYNEYILTRIRTIWGVSSIEIEKRFGREKAAWFIKNIDNYLALKWVKCKNNTYILTQKGWFVSDEITTNLMFI